MPIKSEMTFESAMQELEAIVDKMENGCLSLDESVKYYSRGNELAAFCRKKLNAAEAKVRKLEGNGDLVELQLEQGMQEKQ